jgi:hypothetical protein
MAITGDVTVTLPTSGNWVRLLDLTAVSGAHNVIVAGTTPLTLTPGHKYTIACDQASSSWQEWSSL